MKRLGFYACIGILSIGFFGLSPTTSHAQGEITSDAVLGTGVAADSAAVTAAATPPDPKPNLGNPPVKGCSLFGSSPITDCIDAGVAWLIRNTLLQIAGALLWLSAQLLNYSVLFGILNFKEWAPDSLYSIWIVIRQIVSLVVVFAGLYLGFMYIIGRDQVFTRYVGWLVLFALFVNFSYPLTRVLTDVSNVISLNIYTASVGSGALSSNEDNNSAGRLMMNRLGLDGLIASATKTPDPKNSALSDINSTPNVLVAVIFVTYAAYIFFQAAAILIMRTGVLVLLTVVSPILLIDSVIPKLGDAAMRLRKMFFEQLVVAPVFMIMLALTLKFMEVFRMGPMQGDISSVVTGGQTITTFFNLVLMLIMLHIMIKVTKEVSGKAGEFATNVAGKVGGFALGAASGGAGLLARGSIGASAAVLRDSKWMTQIQGSRMGRGLYGLSNSLAQSTFDTRNVGMVRQGLQTAGLTGAFGFGTQKGLTLNSDQKFAAREASILKKGESIKDDKARSKYFNQATQLNPIRIRKVSPEALVEKDKEIKDKNEAQMAAFLSADPSKRQSMLNQAKLLNDYELQKKLRTTQEYLNIKNDINDPNTVSEKARLLKEMNFDEEGARAFLKKDPFKDLADLHEEKVRKLQEDAGRIDQSTKAGKAAYAQIQAQIGQTNAVHRATIEQLKKDTLTIFGGGMTLESPGQTAQRITSQDQQQQQHFDTSELDIAGFAQAPGQQTFPSTRTSAAPETSDVHTQSLRERFRAQTQRSVQAARVEEPVAA